MIKIDVKFLCRDITGDIESGVYCVPEGCTIAELIAGAEEKYAIMLSNEEKNVMQFLVDGRLADWDFRLQDDQSVVVIRLVSGG